MEWLIHKRILLSILEKSPGSLNRFSFLTETGIKAKSTHCKPAWICLSDFSFIQQVNSCHKNTKMCLLTDRLLLLRSAMTSSKQIRLPRQNILIKMTSCLAAQPELAAEHLFQILGFFGDKFLGIECTLEAETSVSKLTQYKLFIGDDKKIRFLE